MQSAVLRALEFDRIREALSNEALTPVGRERTGRLEPATDAAEVDRLLHLTTEAVAVLREGGSLAISAPDDLFAILESLDIGEQPLEPLQLVGLARFLESVETVASALRQGPPLLSGVAARARSFAAEVRAIRRAIQPSGEVNDDASPALKEFRGKLRRQRAKLRSTLEGLTRERDTAKYLQDQIITDRNGRYVLVLRAEHREALPGIVHGSSASGASLYVEPLSTVDLNNEIVSLVEREREEVLRILLGLTNAIRSRADEFGETLDVAADLDELYAKAQLAKRLGAVAPVRADDGRVEFRGARHPLLVLREADTTSVPVAVDLLVIPPTRALVISGPNTGGKTVALKAVGLLSLMAQSGLLIPVDGGSQFTPFHSIFADIGDEQSIAASLSTFSAHVANIVAMDRALQPPALVLLDEVGGGTDPAEGGALGTAVIDHFRQRGAIVIATTHDDALKSYAATTDGVMTAAFGFDPETYAPTYRLVYGAPGRSLALEIAERLGMPQTVVATARARRSARETQLADHLARMDRELAALERERRLAAADRQEVAGERQAIIARESRLAEWEAVLRRRMDDKLHERLREARQEVDRIVADLKGKAGSLAKPDRPHRPMLTTGDLGSLRSEARAALDSVADRLEVSVGAPSTDTRLDAPPDAGDLVYVAPFGAEGQVRSVSGKQIEVDVRGKRMRVRLEDLRSLQAGKPASLQAGAPVAQHSRMASQPSRLAGPQPSRDLVLIGSTVEEALDRTEKFLDAALLADEHRLRIVHGHGTGRLREALRTHFRQHPLIASVAPGGEDEGGEAATILELKD